MVAKTKATERRREGHEIIFGSQKKLALIGIPNILSGIPWPA
jgi:hypothetical protein